MAEELLAASVRLVAITKGPNGAVLFHNRAEIIIPGRSVSVVDTVGAGDTFIATLLTSLAGHAGDPTQVLDGLAADDLRAFGDRAVAASALVCSRAGADPPTASEIDGRLAEHGLPADGGS